MHVRLSGQRLIEPTIDDLRRAALPPHPHRLSPGRWPGERGDESESLWRPMAARLLVGCSHHNSANILKTPYSIGLDAH
jgi:hypothetical protein